MTSELFKELLKDPVEFRDKRGQVTILYESSTMVLKRSITSKGVFRGLHRQRKPALQSKIIRVVEGKILDFVTDPDDQAAPISYREISAVDDWVLIPSHLAHGFYALEDVVFEYICDGGYNESLEQSFCVVAAIQRELGLENIELSDKDAQGKHLDRAVRSVGYKFNGDRK